MPPEMGQLVEPRQRKKNIYIYTPMPKMQTISTFLSQFSENLLEHGFLPLSNHCWLKLTLH